MLALKNWTCLMKGNLEFYSSFHYYIGILLLHKNIKDFFIMNWKAPTTHKKCLKSQFSIRFKQKLWSK